MYNPEEFLRAFSQTPTYNKLKAEYRHLFSDINDVNVPIDIKPHRCDYEDASIFVYSMFFYLEFLLKKNPKLIADVGCGANFLKKYIPQIIGFDSTSAADVNELFNDKFVASHLGEFDAAFAINSLHFISLKEIANRITQFGKIIKPGGRGYIAFNLKRLLEWTEPHEFAELFDLSKPLTTDDYEGLIRAELKKVKYDIIVEDLSFTGRGFNGRAHYDYVKGDSWPTFEKYIANDLTGVSDDIRDEIMRYTFGSSYDDPANGNIRIVFDV